MVSVPAIRAFAYQMRPYTQATGCKFYAVDDCLDCDLEKVKILIMCCSSEIDVSYFVVIVQDETGDDNILYYINILTLSVPRPPDMAVKGLMVA